MAEHLPHLVGLEVEDYARRAVYVRQQAMTDLSCLVEALGGLVTQAEAITTGPNDGEEERALLDLLEPAGELLRGVTEWLDLADEGECSWLAFVDSHPGLEQP